MISQEKNDVIVESVDLPQTYFLKQETLGLGLGDVASEQNISWNFHVFLICRVPFLLMFARKTTIPT